MLVLGLFADPKLVKERALRFFREVDLAEAFAAVRGVAVPTQLRNELRKSKRNLLEEYRAMVPHRRPVRIQRWSWRRLLLTVGTLFAIFIVIVLILSNLHGAGLV